VLLKLVYSEVLERQAIADHCVMAFGSGANPKSFLDGVKTLDNYHIFIKGQRKGAVSVVATP
jgi:hypothetical protein